VSGNDFPGRERTARCGRLLPGKRRFRYSQPVGQYLLGRLCTIEHHDALRVTLGELVVDRRGVSEERVAALLKPVAAFASCRAERRRHAYVQREVRRQATRSEQVEGRDLRHAEPAATALIGERGVNEAVEQHVRAGGEQGLQPLADELGSRGREHQGLGACGQLQLRVLDEVPQPLGRRYAAWLPQQDELRQRRCEAGCERRLAGPVDAFERDQSAGTLHACATVACVVVSVDSATKHHPHARAVLTAAVEDGRPSHAYLFHGPPGAGKVAAARAFAAELLAEGAADVDDARRRVIAGVHPDLTWVKPSGAAEMLRADVDEAVVSGATRTPFEARRRVFVLERADTMNDTVANSLLKTLEEPPAYAHLILLAGRVSDVLPTVRSRCLAVRFESLSPDQLAEQLVHDDGIPQDTARACARLARGDARLARALAEPSGAALRGAAEAYIRAAVAGDLREHPWQLLLRQSREGGADAAQALAEDVEERAGFLPAKDGRKLRKDGEAAGKRAQRRAATALLDHALHLSALWLRDLVCLHDGAAGSICHTDRVGALREDAARDLPVAALREGVLAIEDARTMLSVNPSEELLLEALALRLVRTLQAA